MPKTKKQTVVIKYGGDEVSINWDPDSASINMPCEGGMVVARGLLRLAERELLSKGTLADVQAIEIECSEGYAVAMGLITMACNFYEVSWKSFVGACLSQQAQSALTIPQPGRVIGGRA